MSRQDTSDGKPDEAIRSARFLSRSKSRKNKKPASAENPHCGRSWPGSPPIMSGEAYSRIRNRSRRGQCETTVRDDYMQEKSYSNSHESYFKQNFSIFSFEKSMLCAAPPSWSDLWQKSRQKSLDIEKPVLLSCVCAIAQDGQWQHGRDGPAVRKRTDGVFLSTVFAVVAPWGCHHSVLPSRGCDCRVR